MKGNALQHLEDALVGGCDIEDWEKFVLVEDFVILGLSSSNTDDAFRHGQQCVHGWRVTVKLVEHDVSAVEPLFILIEW